MISWWAGSVAGCRCPQCGKCSKVPRSRPDNSCRVTISLQTHCKGPPGSLHTAGADASGHAKGGGDPVTEPPRTNNRIAFGFLWAALAFSWGASACPCGQPAAPRRRSRLVSRVSGASVRGWCTVFLRLILNRIAQLPELVVGRVGATGLTRGVAVGPGAPVGQHHFVGQDAQGGCSRHGDEQADHAKGGATG